MNIFSRFQGGGQPTSQLDARQAQARLNQKPQPFLLDVRQPEEFQNGHISGAYLIPLGDLAQRAHELPRDREIICVCRSGSRSGVATRQLQAAGYKAHNLKNGMLGWTSAGLPIRKGG